MVEPAVALTITEACATCVVVANDKLNCDPAITLPFNNSSIVEATPVDTPLTTYVIAYTPAAANVIVSWSVPIVILLLIAGAAEKLSSDVPDPLSFVETL